MAKGYGARGMAGMGGGMNMNMIKQAQKMQQELQEKEYEAKAGGGVVIATVNGKHELKNLVIDPEVVDPDDVEMLQDTVSFGKGVLKSLIAFIPLKLISCGITLGL